ncbi:hypothetical protein [Microvirga aerophila]|uniref:Uncharacterized protein n=1 Tax=Microvirga aerophila TaxID=670291 RepID=A0A512BUQ1_9HYPH|nr:hypothetical protein [Microvirga aerophila]GEO15699.1 hypothetical protein MAE02_33950 [Microvirga aerophila]
MNREWTEEELEILRRDREAKVPVPITAAKLNRPVPATYLRARMIGTQVQTHQAWEEATVARLRELVRADPPMTDKQIAAELCRTITQVRWKLKDLNLIGVRDLSKLAKATASSTVRPAVAKPAVVLKQASAHPPQPSRIPSPRQPEKPMVKAPVIDARTLLNVALRRLERDLETRLKTVVAETEAGMMQAAVAAIAAKRAIDNRLAELRARPIEEAKPEPSRPSKSTAETAQAESSPQKRRPPSSKPAPKPAVRTMVPAAPRGPVAREVQAPPEPTKIIVLDVPAPSRAAPQDAGPAQTSGRGGWKSVRRDPARVAAQARGKATSRADAVDLAQAAQVAIEQFISQRGVTKAEAAASQSLVTRLQARGYIVVREGDGWVIDQRHQIANEAELTAFAEARGISLGMAA